MSDSSSSSETDIEYLSGEERRKRKGEEKRSFPRKKAQRKKAKFRHSWLNVPEFKGWLAKDKSSDEKAFCSHCSQSLCCGKSELRKHAKSAKHSESVRKLEASRKLTTRIDHVLTTDKNEEESLKAKLAAFIVENNLPLSFVETLVPFLKSLPHKAVVEKIRLGKQNVTNVIRQALGPHYNEVLCDQLRLTPFSIIIDETTDVAVKKQLAIAVLFCNKDFEVEVDLLDMVECSDGKAETIFNLLCKVLEDKKIPTENWVGFCADTCNTMFGCENSVVSRIKEKFPSVMCVKCSSHSIHLVASYACKQLPKQLEDLCRTVYNHFNMSAKRRSEFELHQLFTDTPVLNVLAPGQTRWLSLRMCVQRLLQNWDALCSYFQLVVAEDPTHANDRAWQALKNPLLRIQLEFQLYVLELFTDFNLLFQSEKPLFHKIKLEVEILLRKLAMNFMKTSYVRSTSPLNLDPDNASEYLAVEDVYLGVAAHESLQTLQSDPSTKADEREVKVIYECARKLYVEAVKQIKQRFSFEDELFTMCEIL